MDDISVKAREIWWTSWSKFRSILNSEISFTKPKPHFRTNRLPVASIYKQNQSLWRDRRDHGGIWSGYKPNIKLFIIYIIQYYIYNIFSLLGPEIRLQLDLKFLVLDHYILCRLRKKGWVWPNPGSTLVSRLSRTLELDKIPPEIADLIGLNNPP